MSKKKVIFKFKFEIGDLVQIIRPGYVYSTHERLFKELNFKNKEENYLEGKMVDQTWMIFNRTISRYTEFYAIENCFGEQILINVHGIKLRDRDENRDFNLIIQEINQELNR